MSEDLNATEENLGCRSDENPATTNDSTKPTTNDFPDAAADAALSPPTRSQPRSGIRERECSSRERREDRDFDRPLRREFYDRNRSPPPPRERDYHKRGRPSSSPPPSSYRDRRGGGPHSPPPRRPPPFPPYKRRRGDGYEGRRGSPRGVFGHGDRREGMMSYKQFIQELEDDILPTEAERRYEEYKSEYISTLKRAYFNAHKDEEWLKDKYHPTNLLAVIERRNEVAKKLAKDFQLDLENGTLDLGPSFNSSSNRTQQFSEPNSDDDADVGGKRRRHDRVGAKDSYLLDAPKAHLISSEPRRIQVDVEQAQSLVRKLDIEKGIEDNVLCRADNDRMSRDKSHSSSSGPVIIIRGLRTIKGLERIELLDTLLTYLWRVHGLDYYGLIELNEAKGLQHVRIDGKNTDANGKDWENKLDSHWQERLKSLDLLEIMTAKEKIDVTATEALDPHVRKIRDEKYGWKYGCGAKGCTKLFHAAEFVHKHLKLKHPEVVMELTSNVREELYFQNYMDDGNAPGGTPIMQPSFPKKKSHRRRPGRREHAENSFDRSDEPQSRDFPSNNDGALGSNGDEPIFDAFGRQGIAVASFPSDIAPPVLMPVPGAGPLGPFVPAPPEVAMRMLRDHGGPSPFEGGRNGRSGPQLGGPAPIIALPPTFRKDPRCLRSYNDLDAPEDEVTIIDYRSL